VPVTSRTESRARSSGGKSSESRRRDLASTRSPTLSHLLLPPLWRLLGSENASSGLRCVLPTALTERSSFGEEDAGVAIEVVDPPRRHPTIHLRTKPLLAQCSKPVNGFGVVPPLDAPVLVCDRPTDSSTVTRPYTQSTNSSGVKPKSSPL
jgi:hypothetical protein